MKCVISGVFKFKGLVVVHCIENTPDTNGNRRVSTVFLKEYSDKAKQCEVGKPCEVCNYKYNDKYYNYIKF